MNTHSLCIEKKTINAIDHFNSSNDFINFIHLQLRCQFQINFGLIWISRRQSFYLFRSHFILGVFTLCCHCTVLCSTLLLLWWDIVKVRDRFNGMGRFKGRGRVNSVIV